MLLCYFYLYSIIKHLKKLKLNQNTQTNNRKATFGDNEDKAFGTSGCQHWFRWRDALRVGGSVGNHVDGRHEQCCRHGER